MSFSKQQFMEERQKESEQRKYSIENIKYRLDFAANLRDQATKVKGKYTRERLLLIAGRMEDMQRISSDDQKFLKDY